MTKRKYARLSRAWFAMILTAIAIIWMCQPADAGPMRDFQASKRALCGSLASMQETVDSFAAMPPEQRANIEQGLQALGDPPVAELERLIKNWEAFCAYQGN